MTKQSVPGPAKGSGRKTRLILAPLQGFTDVTFRNVFSRHFSGIDEAVAPFISTMGEERLKPSRLNDVAPETNQALAVVPQILSNVAVDFVFLARHLAGMGYNRFNWNLGCPHAKIAKKLRGSGLLAHPDRIDAFLDQAMPELPGTLSVKIRLGRSDKSELSALLKVLDRYPLEQIILHPRTGIQMYRGNADLDAFGQALFLSRHTFTYNGDIVDKACYDRVERRFPGVSDFMIGRGILSNPFLAEEIRGIQAPGDRLARLRSFHDDLFASYQEIFSGPGHLTGRMKGFWTYLGRLFPGREKQLKKILKSGSLKNFQTRVDDLFNTSSL